MTLVELLVATAILGIVMTGIVSGLTGALRIGEQGRARSTAANLATAELEILRQADFDAIDLGRTTRSQTVGQTDFTLTRDVTWVTEDSAANACEGGSGSKLAYLRVNVTVAWPDGNTPLVSQDTLLTPPVNDYDPYAGHVAIALRDRDGQPLAGIRAYLQEVTVVGATRTRTGPILDGVSDDDGCVFFPYVNERGDLAIPPSVDDFDVWVDEPGYVDVETLSQLKVEEINVQIAATTDVPIEYDEAARVTVDVVTENGAPLPPLPLSYVKRGGNEGPPFVTAMVGTSFDLSPLFPFPSGYAVYVGTCPDADPATHGAERTIAPTEPSGSSEITLTMPEVEINVLEMDSHGHHNHGPEWEPDPPKPLKKETVTGTHCGQPYVLGLTDDDGKLRVALPYGDWTFSIRGGIEPTMSTTYTVTPSTSGTPTPTILYDKNPPQTGSGDDD